LHSFLIHHFSHAPYSISHHSRHSAVIPSSLIFSRIMLPPLCYFNVSHFPALSDCLSGVSLSLFTNIHSHTHRRPLRRCSPVLLACLLLSGDIELNPGPTNFTLSLLLLLLHDLYCANFENRVRGATLNIRSILHPRHSAALSDNMSPHKQKNAMIW